MKEMTLPDLQQYVADKLVARNLPSPLPDTILHLMEEVGEVVRAMRKGDQANLEEELADCLWFVITAANSAGVDLAAAFAAKETKNIVRFGA